MATNYARGRGLEYRVIATLTKAGYQCIRAAGSKGVVDVVADPSTLLSLGPRGLILEWPTKQGLYVQCKLGKGGCPPGERVALGVMAQATNRLGLVAHQPAPRKPIRWRLLNAQGEYGEDWSPG